MERNMLSVCTLILCSTLILIAPGLFSSVCGTFILKLVPTTIGSVPVLILLNLVTLASRPFSFRKFFNAFCTFAAVGWFRCKLTAPIGMLFDHHITLAHCQIRTCMSSLKLLSPSYVVWMFSLHAKSIAR